MEAVIFIGLPGSGKSSFYKDRFFSTHVRISLDLLKTRYREQRLLQLCLATDQRFVIDNTNLTKQSRAKYIQAASAARFKVLGYYFQSTVADCVRRNEERPERDRVPLVAIFSAAKKMEPPSWDEGFNRLFLVRLEAGQFILDEWPRADTP